MARCWVNLVGVAPLLLGMMVAVPQMVVAPLVVAQTSESSQQTEAQRLYDEGEQLRQQRTRESLQQALAKFQQALPLFRANGDRNGEADNLDSIGRVYDSLGQTQQALDYLQQAIPIWREVRNLKGEAITLNSIGRVYINIGQPQQALNFYQQALLLWREVGDRSREADTLNNISGVYSNIGQPQQALNYHQQALTISREVGNSSEEMLRQRISEAATLRSIGSVYLVIGQPQQALNYYQQALTISREVGNSPEEMLRQRSREAFTLNSIGDIYQYMGQPQLTLNYFQQSLAIYREVGNRSGEADTLISIGFAYKNTGQPQQALTYFQQASSIIREINSPRVEANNLLGFGEVYQAIGQPQLALNYLQQALTIRRESGDQPGESVILNLIGEVYREIGQPQQTLSFFQQALTNSREVGDRSREADTLYNLALVHQTLNDQPAALQSIQAAISIIEDIRGQLIDPDSRTSYFATVQEYYKLQIELLMQLHQQNPNQSYNIQAFNVTERSKARTLLELLAESRAEIRTGVDPQLLQQEQDIQTQLTALDQRRIELASARNVNRGAIDTLETQREILQSQYRNLQSQIRQTSPKYAALKYPQPLTLEQTQQQILDDNTVILSYSLGKDRSYLWLISKTEMSSYELPAGKILEDLVNQKVLPQFTNPHANRVGFLSATSELSNILLQPVLEKTRNKRIVIISDGALQYVPFGALPDPRADNNRYQPLLVNNEVVYLPSASTLHTLRNEAQNRPPASKTIAILADPVFAADDQRVNQHSIPAPTNELPLFAQNFDRAARNIRGNWNRLPGTRQEANTILNLVPENNRLAYFDFQANRENALSEQLSQYRFIHWATHGFVNTQNPELSGIVMSLVDRNGAGSNGYLLLEDIFNLSFNADLVVLSACETGLGEVVQGEGLIGLTRGLMYAGTPRVVTSLWAVPDSQTADLMGKFYEKMLQQNLSPGSALRAAQLEMFRSRNWVAPYYWAAFTLQGEWN